jgi:hypothetical protein
MVARQRTLDAIEASQEQRRIVGAVEVLAQRVLDDVALGDPASSAILGEARSQFDGKARADPIRSTVCNIPEGPSAASAM